MTEEKDIADCIEHLQMIFRDYDEQRVEQGGPPFFAHFPEFLEFMTAEPIRKEHEFVDLKSRFRTYTESYPLLERLFERLGIGHKENDS